MAQPASALITLCCQIAKCPAFTSQAGTLLNMILEELCLDYDFDDARATFSFSFNTGVGQNSGPYALPSNWLRASKDDVFYTIQGVKYVMIPFSLAEFDSCVQQPGLNAYPENYAVDNSPREQGLPPNMYVWPPAGGSYPVTARYYQLIPDLTTAQLTDGVTIPWFPNQNYLKQRLSGELMQLTNDDRAASFLGDNDGANGRPAGAAWILDKYLKNKDDSQVVKSVSLDRRRFGLNFDKLKNTKTIGW